MPGFYLTRLLGLMACSVIWMVAVASTGFCQERPVVDPKNNKHDRPDTKPLSPEAALQAFQVADDLRIEEVLADPLIAQPLQVSFDTRGRLWLVEYRQYPHPAGLKVKSHDVFWRAVYDKVPEAPPHHVRGKDRITIHEDTNGDGTFDKHTVFVDGLNITSAVAVNTEGAWVLNPPYLLFYPDRNQDDIPDGDPEVHLAGFGLQDTHSVVNSLTWGPDGWLYAAQGSTVNGEVIRPGLDKKPQISLGQNIWRYHPRKRIYEIFAEGGGNAFSVEFDRQGRIYSGHNGGDTRGFHYVQGGFYRKGFSKHGPLSNPYAFGFFDSIDHHSAQRFTHSIMFYEAETLPERYRGKLFGVEPLQGSVVYAEAQAKGSTLQTKDIDRPVTSSDSWFRPVDIKLGPDGAIYICDWYDGRVAHLFTMEEQVDAELGRVYRLAPREGKLPAIPNLRAWSEDKLLSALTDSNRELRNLAIRRLVEIGNAQTLASIEQLLRDPAQPAALELLWVRQQLREWTDLELSAFWTHPDPFVRAWSIRLACDDHQLDEALAGQLAEIALGEEDVHVRSQISSSIRRLPPAQTARLCLSLLNRSADVSDPHLPLLAWWNVESIASRDARLLLEFTQAAAKSESSLFRDEIAERLVRRLVASRNAADWKVCEQLLLLPAAANYAEQFVRGFELGTEGQSLAGFPANLLSALERLGKLPLPLQLRLRQPAAVAEATRLIQDAGGSPQQRLPLIRVAAELPDPQLGRAVLEAARSSKNAELRVAAWLALQGPLGEAVQLTRAEIPEGFAAWGDREKSALCLTFASRAEWARELIEARRAGTLTQADVPQDALLKMTFHKDPALQQAIQELWGSLAGAATAEMVETVDRLTVVLEDKTGDPYAGKKLYNQRCAKCHELFAEGEFVGPGLTSYQRNDRRHLLLQIVNPSLEIREGFELRVVVTADGRILTGFVTYEDDNALVIRGSEGEDVRVSKEDIDDMIPQKKSLMPEDLLKGLTDQQVADLFAYLQSAQPLR